MSVLGAVESEIVECFEKGGGVHYHCYSRFHKVMAEESANTVAAALREHILPLAPELEDALTAGIDVLDIGCGSGLALCRMAEEFPNSRFLGYDFSEEGIAAAKAEAERRGLTNLRFEVKDLATMDEAEHFDLITAFDVIHDQAKPDVVLGNVSAALKSDGTFLMQDISTSSHVEKNMQHPIGPFILHDLLHALHDGLARAGRGRIGRCLGRRTRAADARRGRLRQRANGDVTPRRAQRIFHCEQRNRIRVTALANRREKRLDSARSS